MRKVISHGLERIDRQLDIQKFMQHRIKLNHLLKVLLSTREQKLLAMQRAQDLDLDVSTGHSDDDKIRENDGTLS